jgi:hypothetical protein
MIYPGSVIWKRISDEWLVSKAASGLFAVSSFVIAGVTWLLFGYNLPQNPPLTVEVLCGILGVSGPIAMFFLWGGMWRYWMRGEPSNRFLRRLWFVALVLGIWYGAILYYLLVYLPGAGTRAIERPSHRGNSAPDGPDRIRIFGRILLYAWVLLFVAVGLIFALPMSAAHVLHSFAPYFQVIPLLLLIATCAYGLIRMYRAGMSLNK